MKYWQRRIEPRIYNLEGKTVSGVRHGRWTYHLKNGTKYVDAEYKFGERHGDWLTYYPTEEFVQSDTLRLTNLLELGSTSTRLERPLEQLNSKTASSPA